MTIHIEDHIAHFVGDDSAELVRDGERYRINALPELVKALEECVSDLRALLNASDSDYARPDPGTVAQADEALAKARSSP